MAPFASPLSQLARSLGKPGSGTPENHPLATHQLVSPPSNLSSPSSSSSSQSTKEGNRYKGDDMTNPLGNRTLNRSIHIPTETSEAIQKMKTELESIRRENYALKLANDQLARRAFDYKQRLDAFELCIRYGCILFVPSYPL